MKIILDQSQKEEVIKYITSWVDDVNGKRHPTPEEIQKKYGIRYNQYRRLVKGNTDLPLPKSLSEIKQEEDAQKRIARKERKVFFPARIPKILKKIEVIVAAPPAKCEINMSDFKILFAEELLRQRDEKEREDADREKEELDNMSEKELARKEYAKRYREKQLKKPLARLKTNVERFQKKSKCDKKFTVEDVIAKFGPSPRCYLTGLPIDYEDTSTYQLDHFVPIAIGGDSTIENLRLCNPTANQMKNGFSLEHFLRFCHIIADNNPK